MTIKFTVKLSDETVRALDEVHGASGGAAVKDLLVGELRGFLDDARSQCDAEGDEEQDDE